MTNYDPNRAAYRVLAVHGFYGPDDTLYTVDEQGEPAEIYFDGEPNEELEPLNDLARERMRIYIEKLDNQARIVAEKTGRPYIERPRNLDGQVELATAVQRSQMAIMGVKKEVDVIERIDSSPVAETGKRGRGRPSGALSVKKRA